MTDRRNIALRFVVLTLVGMALGACSSLNPFSDDAEESASDQSVSGQSVTPNVSNSVRGAPANPYMWQATLESVGVMPLETVNNAEGRIATEWHIPPGAPLERFRIDVAFSSRALRAESMSILVERQELSESGEWLDSPTSPAVTDNLVNAILARALVLRQESGAL